MSISFGRFALNVVNRLLALFNVELNTLTAAREENRRVKAAVSRGDFEQPIYTLPASFHSERFKEILAALPGYSHRFSSFRDSDKNDVGYSFQNGFFSSPDAEVLYCMVRTACPRRIVEIGCGNSTKIIRQAIRDGGFPCQHTCVDPFPREEVSSLTDIVIREKIETIDPTEILGKLAQGDILFIDTSHEVMPANDVAYIYGRLLPQIASGVVVHIHDIFLPYEYPSAWIEDLGLKWGEQYVVEAMLTASNQWEVLWPGYYLQRILPTFQSHFPNSAGRNAQSLWIRRQF